MTRALMTGPAGGLLALLWLVTALEAAAAGLRPFPHASLVEEEVIEAPDYRVIASAAYEVGNNLRVSSAFRLPVRGQSRLFVASSSYGREQVLAHYEGEIERLQAQVLFSCDGRDCGSSNVWANTVFDIASLYGRDQEQNYRLVAWRGQDNQLRLMVLYVVTRGNREVQFLQQVLVPGEGAEVPGLNIAERRLLGPFTVPFTLEGGEPRLKADDVVSRVLELAEKYEGAAVGLAGYHPAGDMALDALLAASKAAVEAMVRKLEEGGLARDRLHTLSAGPFIEISEPGRKGPRVEIVLLRRR